MSRVLLFVASRAHSGGGHSLPVSDRAAVAWATRTNPAVTAICPPGDVAACEYALAAGCRLVPMADSVEALPFDQAAFGCGFLERFGDEFAARLAERRTAALVFDVLSCVTEMDGTLTIIRDAGRGARDVLSIRGPVVFGISPAVARPAYVSRFRRQQARHELSEPALSMNPEEAWQLARPRTRRVTPTLGDSTLDQRMDSAFGMAPATVEKSGALIVDDARTCAQHLLRYLAHHGFQQRPQSGDELLVKTNDPRDSTPQLRHDTSTVCNDSSHTRWDSDLARRPRQPHDAADRRLRQPRHIVTRQETPLHANTRDRRPRRVGQLERDVRGPRVLLRPRLQT